MTRETEYVVDCSSQVAGRPGLGRPRTADRGGQTGKAGGVTRACSRKKCRPHLRAGPSRGGAAGQAVGVKESGRAEEAGQAAGRRQPPPTRPQAHLSSVSSAPSCLSSGRPRYLIWLCWVFVAAQAFSLVAERGDYSLVVVYRFGARVLWLLGFSSCSTWLSSCCLQALEHGLNSCGTWA